MSFQISNDTLTLSDFNPSSSSVAIGQNSGVGLNCVSIGNNAGSINQGINCVAIGLNAGSNNQALRSVAIGEGSGSVSQGTLAVGIGTNAGGNTQAQWGVAVGSEAAVYSQGLGSVAIGHLSGWNNQAGGCVSIGRGSGHSTQGQGAIAIGYLAGNASQGSNAIAIGNSAGSINQAAGSIVINAGGTWSADTTYQSNPGCFIRPVRGLAASTAVYYNTTTFELSYLTSSALTKHNIEDLLMDTSVVDYLRPKTYIYNSDPEGGIQVGYIAEEVQTLNKHFATYDKPDGDPVAINYNTIVVFLVEEIKKLKKRIEILERK